MLDQKNGINRVYHNTARMGVVPRKARQHFSRRKAFVVGALLIAARESGIVFAVPDLNTAVDGANVNRAIVRNALADIGIPLD